MSETCDTSGTSAPQQPPNEVAPSVEDDVQPEPPVVSTPAENPVVGEQYSYRAVFFDGPRKELPEEQTASEYVQYLDDCGFIVNSVPFDTVEKIKEEIKNAAKDTKQFVAVVLMESDRPADLDDIVNCLRDTNVSTQKLLIFCRISDTESEEKADCMKLMRPTDCQKNLRNMVLLSIAVKARKEAVKFLHLLVDLKKENWHLSNGLGEVIQYEIQSEVYDQFKMKTQNGLTSKFSPPGKRLLKDNEKFNEIIGDGSYLKQLDSETIERLKNDSNPMEDVVYSIDSRKAIKKALIIHNVNFLRPTEDRPQSYTDFQNLSHVLSLMQFEVTEKVNLTAVEIQEAVRDFANDESHGDACILVIMSHGSLGAICGTDYRSETNLGLVEESKILKLMSTGTGVKAKPRVVLVQACRADSGESQARKPTMSSENVCTTMVQRAIHVAEHQGNEASHDEPPPEQSGMIVAHSTSPGHYAFRSPYGSRFILALCATFYEFAHKEDLVSMLTRINFIMVRGFRRPELKGEVLSLQMPCWTVQTHKKFFLVDTSGLFEKQAVAPENQLEKKSSEADVD